MNYGRQNDRRKEMHHAVCDECGSDCKVPFRPSNNKPIFCSECFEHEGRDRGSRDRNNRRDNRNDYDGEYRRDRAQMHHAVCDECGDDCEVPFRPNGSKPIYCSYCFEDGQRDNSRGNNRSHDRNNKHDNHVPKPKNDSKLQKQLLAKLDTIIEILQDLAYEEETPEIAKITEVLEVPEALEAPEKSKILESDEE